MPLSPPTSRRALKHTRTIRVEAFARDDGLLDLDAHITDTKPVDVEFPWGVRPAGDPVHDLWLRLTVDRQLNVLDVEAVSDAVPYRGYCDTIGPAYRQLIGLNLRQGFRHDVKERLSGIKGCTHLTELAQVLPTAAIQALAPVSIDDRIGEGEGDEHAGKPFPLDKCHALDSTGPAVARYFPRWAIQVVEAAKTE